jgi:drug/metabolite transporter (DMT)-like permease
MDFWGLFSGILAASIWGGMYVVSKVVLDVIPPFTLLTLRLLLGFFSLLPFIIKYKGGDITRQQIFRLLGVGLVGYGISLGFQFVGTKLSTAANGSMVTSATPAFIILFAALILHERISPQRLAALILASIGVIIVLDPRHIQISPYLFWGNVSLILAALTWALYSVLIRVVTRGIPVLVVSVVCFLGGLPITIPAAIYEVSTIGLERVNLGIIFGVVYLGVVSTGLAMFLWNLAFSRLEAGIASLTFFAQPVVGVGLGTSMLGEQLTPLFYVGGVLIVLGLVLSVDRKKSTLSNSMK